MDKYILEIHYFQAQRVRTISHDCFDGIQSLSSDCQCYSSFL